VSAAERARLRRASREALREQGAEIEFFEETKDKDDLYSHRVRFSIAQEAFEITARRSKALWAERTLNESVIAFLGAHSLVLHWKIMAHPIEPTPPITDPEDVERFLADMASGVPVTKARLEEARRFVAEVEEGKPLPCLSLPPRREDR
jgi:hypothetical protein